MLAEISACFETFVPIHWIIFGVIFFIYFRSTVWLGYVNCMSFAGEHIQRRFPPPVPSRATDQAAPTGLYHSDTPLDIRAEFQSLTLRVPSHRDAILHLRHHRDAGLLEFLLSLLDS